MSNQTVEERQWVSPLPLPDYLEGRGLTRGLLLFSGQISQARARVREGARSLARLYPKAPFHAGNVEETLVAELAEKLLAIITRTLVLELNVARLQGFLQGDCAAERFEHFLKRLEDPHIVNALLAEYPVMAQQVAGRLDCWADYSLEFLRHLCEDYEALCSHFFVKQAPLLTAARSGAGDTHRNGRSVIIAHFTGDVRLVYKPRSLQVDEHFNELLEWLNQHGAQPAFRPVKTLDCGQHGWSEFVRREACQNSAGVKRFYQRQGAYLALLYTLEASDFHCENLIAAGEHPMLIDLEALFHPRFEHDDAEATVAGALGYSALKVGLLPARFWVDEKSQGIDMSGMGSAAGQPIPHGVPQWEQADTDEMHLVRKTMQMPGADNRPLFNGSEVNALDYAADVAAGFEDMYRILLRHRKEALSFLQKFAGDEVRVIARGTQVYASLLYESYHPDRLRDTKDRAQLFARLAGVDPLRFAEHADLMRGDVPLFNTRPGARHVWTSDAGCIPNFFAESSLTLVTRRFAQLSEHDLERQLWIIRASLATLASVSEGPAAHPLPPKTGRPVGAKELLEEASRIGDRLEKLALGHEEVSWLGLTPHDEKTYKLAALETDLYDGLPGVILFLAYLSSLTGEARYQVLARAALKMLRRILTERPGMRLVGGFMGWGGLIYCFAHLSALWNDAELLAEANAMAEKAGSWIEADDHLDIACGVAGLALAAGSLPGHVSLAQRCGQHLLNTAKKMEHGVGWYRAGLSTRPLTGFAHGNAGTAYALLEMAARANEPRFRQLAREGFKYERSVFNAQQGNWPDFRENRVRDYLVAWCHGAPGIGLSRMCALRHLNDDPPLRTEIEAALQATLQGFGGNHSLCHGDLGNLDTILSAATALQDQNWAHQANLLAGATLDNMRETGWVCGNALGVETPGLMTGLAGIGYGLLRLAAPLQVPSVLTLEPPRRKA